MKNLLRQLFTESDNVTHDLYKYLAVLAILTGLGLNIYTVVIKGAAFVMSEFGIGIGALFAGAGAALAMKPESAQKQQS